MKTLIIGGMGFLGSAITKILIGKNRNVIVADKKGSQEKCDDKFGKSAAEYCECDVSKEENLYFIFKDVDEVYNLAADIGTSLLNQTPIKAIKTNIIGAVNVFKHAIQNGVSKIFYPSKPNIWNNVYSITKSTAEQFIPFYQERFSGSITSLRMYNLYGPNQKILPVKNLIPIVSLQCKTGTPVNVYGNGEQSVDLICVEDAARMAVDLTDKCHKGVFDCGRGHDITVNEIVEMINGYFGNKSKVFHGLTRDGETPNTRLKANMSWLNHHLPGFKFSDFFSSINNTIKWYEMLSDRETNKIINLLQGE